MMKRILAMVLTVALCLTMFVGCGGSGDSGEEVSPSPTVTADPAVIDYDAAFAKYDPDTVVMTVDGKDVTWSIFFYMLYSSLSQIEYYMGNIYWDEICLGDMTYDGYTMDMTLTMLKQLYTVERKAAELKLKLTKDDQKLIADNKESVMQQYCGENATEQDFEDFLLSEIYLTPDAFTFINENSLFYEKVFVESIGEAGEKITADELQAYIESVPYITAKHILLMTVNPDTNEPLSDEEIADAKAQAEDILAQLQAIDDRKELLKTFDELMNEHSDDTGLAIFPEGYTFTYNEMYPVFEEAAFALNEYEISDIVESQAGYHILLRLPTTGDCAVDYDYQSGTFYTVLAYAATDIYSQRLSAWMEECDVEWAEGFENLTAKEIFS